MIFLGIYSGGRNDIQLAEIQFTRWVQTAVY